MATFNYEYEKIFQTRIFDGMLPFTETPSDNHGNRIRQTYGTIEKRIDATELFSIFTADIIRKKVIFTR